MVRHNESSHLTLREKLSSKWNITQIKNITWHITQKENSSIQARTCVLRLLDQHSLCPPNWFPETMLKIRFINFKQILPNLNSSYIHTVNVIWPSQTDELLHTKLKTLRFLRHKKELYLKLFIISTEIDKRCQYLSQISMHLQMTSKFSLVSFFLQVA